MLEKALGIVSSPTWYSRFDPESHQKHRCWMPDVTNVLLEPGINSISLILKARLWMN
jgi:hypothetical protein